jgi:tRNA A-37 threonylcarbamoyl transferase component Bud32
MGCCASKLLATLEGNHSVRAVACYTGGNLFNGSQAGAVRVVSGSESSIVRVWDLETKRLLATLKVHKDKDMTAVACYTTKDGVRVVSGSRDRTIRVCDPETQKLLATLEQYADVHAVACYTTQAGAVRVVSGSESRTVTIWDPDTQRRLATLEGHTGIVIAFASYTTKDGAVRVVSGSRDRTIKIWDPETQKLLATLQGHANTVLACYTTQDGAVRVVSGSHDSTIKIWDPETKRLLATLKGHTEYVNAVACYTTQASAARVVSGSDDKTIKIWDPEAQRLLATLYGHTKKVTAVASYTTQAGAVRVVSGSCDGTVKVWRTSDKARTASQTAGGTKVAPATTKSASSTKAAVAAGTAVGAALTASQMDVLGPLSGILTALPAAAPPPLSMCLMPFAHALAELGLAVRQVRFNKEAAVMLQRRGLEIAQKLQDVVKATQGLPTGQVEAVARTVTAIGQALDEAAKFLQQFSKKGAFSKLCSGTLDARRFGLLDKRLCELSTELGSALDLQQLALQAQRFEKIEGLIQLLGQQTVDANNQAAAQRAAILCGIPKGSAVESEELSALGLKMDQIAADVSTVIDQNTKQQESLDEVKEMVAAKNSELRGRALARQEKERTLVELEIELDSVEEQPFAKGSQGEVHRGKYQGDTVVLKKTSLVGMLAVDRAKVLKAFATELTIMTQLRSPRIVSVIGAITVDSSFLGLVLEYCEGGTLREALAVDDYATAVDEAQRRRWLLDVALGMSYLYSKGVEHRDLKSLNVLLDASRRRCKVSDFGLSKSESLNTAATQSTMGGAKGTPAYMAPELLQSNTFTEKTDVYAYGMVVFEVLAGDIPWRGLNQMQIMMQAGLQKQRPPVPEGAPADLVALMQRCWDHEPDARPTFAAIKAELRSGPDTPAR